MSNSDPAALAFSITPHDSTDLSKPTRGIYVGGAGNIVVVFPNDTAITFTNVIAGSILPVVAKRINSTSTTATGLVGFV